MYVMMCKQCPKQCDHRCQLDTDSCCTMQLLAGILANLCRQPLHPAGTMPMLEQREQMGPTLDT